MFGWPPPSKTPIILINPWSCAGREDVRLVLDRYLEAPKVTRALLREATDKLTKSWYGVVAHEIAHNLVFDHGPDFVRVLETLPDVIGRQVWAD